LLSFSITKTKQKKKQQKTKKQRKPPHLLNLSLNPTSCTKAVDPKIAQKKPARNLQDR
jgi:hypothetical protein